MGRLAAITATFALETPPVCRECRAPAVREGDAGWACPSCGVVLRRSLIPREAACGELPAPGRVVMLEYTSAPGGILRAGITGARRCGSGWRCARCALIVQREAAEVLQLCNLGHRDGGGWVYLLTATGPHARTDRLERTRSAVTEAWRNCIQGKAWVAARERFAIVDTTRALEVTHGPNGWHPHLHCLIYVRRRLTPQRREAMRRWFAERWADAAVNNGLGAPDKRHGLRIDDADREGRYLAKMGYELSSEIHKEAKCSKCNDVTPSRWGAGRRRCAKCGHEQNRNVWQMFEDLGTHQEPRDRALLKQWWTEIPGARRLTWAKGRWCRNVRVRHADFRHIERHRCECGTLLREHETTCRCGGRTTVERKLVRRVPQLNLGVRGPLPPLPLGAEIRGRAHRDPRWWGQLVDAYEQGDLRDVRALLGPLGDEWAVPDDGDAEILAEGDALSLARRGRLFSATSWGAATPVASPAPPGVTLGPPLEPAPHLLGDGEVATPGPAPS